MSEEPLSSACLYGLKGWQNFLPDTERLNLGVGNCSTHLSPATIVLAAVAQSGQSAESPSASSGTITMPRKRPQACFRRRKLVSLNAERLPRKNKPRSEDAGSSPARRFFLGGPGLVLERRGRGARSFKDFSVFNHSESTGSQESCCLCFSSRVGGRQIFDSYLPLTVPHRGFSLGWTPGESLFPMNEISKNKRFTRFAENRPSSGGSL